MFYLFSNKCFKLFHKKVLEIDGNFLEIDNKIANNCKK